MTILLIDDLRNFRKEPDGLRVARNSGDALKILASEPDVHYTEIWLDHDLGADDKITRVVDYLCERAFNDNPVNVDVVYIQSSNPVGVRQMLQGLDRYGYRALNVTQTDTEKIFYNSEVI